MTRRVVSALALAAGLSVALTGAVVAADDLREVYDNKSGTITGAIDNENWSKAEEKSREWVAQLGAYDGAYPDDVDDADCTRAYDELYTASGVAAFGGQSMGVTEGAPGLIGTVLYNAALIEGPAVRAGVDACIADAAVTETEGEAGAPESAG